MNKEFYLILLIGVILLGIILIIRLRNHNKKQQSNFTSIIKYEQDQAHQWQNQYTTLFTEVKQEEAIQKEIAKRRRVTPKDKAIVFERDHKTCQICGISYDFVENLCTGLGDYILFEIDHVQSVSQGGTGADTDNLQCLCWRCNRKKSGTKTNDEVKSTINYGIDKLEINQKDESVKYTNDT